MESEKKYITGWWFWSLALMIISGIILTVLNWGTLFGRTVVERKIFENSYQYSEARKAEIATYEAQLAEIDSKLMNPSLREDDKANLEAEKSAITVRLNAAKRRAVQ